MATVEDPISGHDDGEEACVYFYVHRLKKTFIYKIDDDENSSAAVMGKTDKPAAADKEQLVPAYERDNEGRLYPGFAAVGSTIYLIGGGSVGSRCERMASRDLFYVDTNDSDKVWKQGKAMNFGRSRSLAFTVNDQIYSIGGHNICKHGDFPKTEVYDPEDDCWRPYNGDLRGVPRTLAGLAVLDGGKQVLIYTSNLRKGGIWIYNVEDHDCSSCSKLDLQAFGFACSFTVLDNDIVFVAGYSQPPKANFILLGYDFRKESPCPTAFPVNGLDKLIEELGGLSPGPIFSSDYTYLSAFARMYLVPIGRYKLALIWTRERRFAGSLGSTFDLFCLKMEVKINKYEPGRIELLAHSGSLSSHLVGGSGIVQAIPVYSGRNRGKQLNADKEDEYGRCKGGKPNSLTGSSGRKHEGGAKKDCDGIVD